MRWFGEDWGAPVCSPEDRVPAPAGRRCGWCDGPVQESDRGVVLPFAGAAGDPPDLPYHLACLMRSLGVEPG